MTDELMIANFQANRDTFEQLNQMVNQEVQEPAWEMGIGVKGDYRLLGGPDLSEPRRESYRALLREIGMSALSAGTWKEYFGVKVYVPRPVFSIMVPEKSYLLAQSQPTDSVITQEDTGAYLFPFGKEICRPLEGQWYVCLDARQRYDEGITGVIYFLFVIGIIPLTILVKILVQQVWRSEAED
jgi:hypothetical protein